MTIHPLRPWFAADLGLDADEKRWLTARARVAIRGGVLRRIESNDGSTSYLLGLHKFASLDEVEDALDAVDGDAA